MEYVVIKSLFFILLTAFLGGFFSKVFKLNVFVGYIIAGILAGLIIPKEAIGIKNISEIGLILLLFSVGLELSLSKLLKVGWISVLGAIAQMLIVGIATYILLNFLGISPRESLILSAGFSLSSTAVVVKLLEEKSQLNSIQGDIMVGWLLTQDLAVVPIMSILPLFLLPESKVLTIGGGTLLTSFLIVFLIYFLGKMVVPFLIRAITSSSRELLTLGSLVIALGVAYLVSFFGISPALGAFLAGIVISETQENHAIFSETRPLRELFVILFFVTLGFFISPANLVSHLGLILGLSAFNILLKSIVVFLIMIFVGYKSRAAVATAIGLSQIGEFSFVIFLTSEKLGILSPELASVGTATALVTLICTPFLFRFPKPVWRKIGHLIKQNPASFKEDFKDHVVICGYGRMGSWIGKALDQLKIPFVIIDYNYKVVRKARVQGIPVIFGDPSEPEILEHAKIRNAKAVVVAIPDLVTQEEVISYCQSVVPNISIFARAHLDEDVSKLSQMRIKKVIQPEFEASLGVIKEIMRLNNKNKEEIATKIISLRRLHSLQQ